MSKHRPSGKGPASRAVDAYIQLNASLTSDGYWHLAVDELTIEDLVALTHGNLREPDGTVNLPLPRALEPGFSARVSGASLKYMDDLLHALVEIAQGPHEPLGSIIDRMGWMVHAEDVEKRGRPTRP